MLFVWLTDGEKEEISLLDKLKQGEEIISSEYICLNLMIWHIDFSHDLRCEIQGPSGIHTAIQVICVTVTLENF